MSKIINIENYEIELEQINKSLEELSSSGLSSKEIKEQTKIIKDLQKTCKANIKESQKQLLATKEFFSELASTMAMKNLDEYKEFVLVPVDDVFYIFPNIENFDNFIIFKQETENNFVEFLKETEGIIFTEDDYNLFRKLSSSPGKTGLKLIPKKIEFNETKYIFSGTFYNDGKLDVEFEHEFKTTKVEESIITELLELIDNINIEIDFDKTGYIVYKENNLVILEMSEDMCKFHQKNALKYKIKYEKINEDFCKVIIMSESDNCKIYHWFDTLCY